MESKLSNVYWSGTVSGLWSSDSLKKTNTFYRNTCITKQKELPQRLITPQVTWSQLYSCGHSTGSKQVCNCSSSATHTQPLCRPGEVHATRIQLQRGDYVPVHHKEIIYLLLLMDVWAFVQCQHNFIELFSFSFVPVKIKCCPLKYVHASFFSFYRFKFHYLYQVMFFLIVILIFSPNNLVNVESCLFIHCIQAFTDSLMRESCKILKLFLY